MREAQFLYYAGLDPALLELKRTVLVAAKMRGNRDRFWSEEIKSVLVTLVGWARRPPGAPRVEHVRSADGLRTLDDIRDAGRRQDLADRAALTRADASDVFVHRELATVQAYRTVFNHLREIFDGVA